MYKFGQRSKLNFFDVKSDLVRVAYRALEICCQKGYCDFCVTCGMRTIEEQSEMVSSGRSKTMNSRHLTGHAIDVAAWVNGGIDWTWEYYEQIAKSFKQAADELDIDIEWGGDWKSFKDGVHFQLSRKEYPG